MNSPSLRAVFVGATILAQAGCQQFRDCSTVDVSAAQALPELLSETGLYSDISAEAVSAAAIEFSPQFPLWTDGADKRRWLVLPEGESVDSTDPHDWVFPVGTQFFKEFTRDGTRIETRLNLKTAAGWTAATYIWNEGGSDADRELEGIEDAAGTSHDVPTAGECLACHGGRRNFTLGFSATQIDVATRSVLYDDGVLSHPVESETHVDPVAMAGLGVLHGNCSHCHNGDRDEQPQATTCYAPEPEDTFDVTLPADLSSVEEAPALLTARWQLGGPDDSEILDRMSVRNHSGRTPSMPPLGTELVDEEGLAAVQAFIDDLPANAN